MMKEDISLSPEVIVSKMLKPVQLVPVHTIEQILPQ